MIATRAACVYDYQRIHIGTDTGQHTEQIANPTQRTSVALTPSEVAQGLLISHGVAQMSWEWGAEGEEPTPNPTEISQAEAQQTTAVSARGATTGLEGHCTLCLPATTTHQKGAGWI